MAVYRGLYRGRPGCAAYKVLKLAVLYALRVPYVTLHGTLLYGTEERNRKAPAETFEWPLARHHLCLYVNPNMCIRTSNTRLATRRFTTDRQKQRKGAVLS